MLSACGTRERELTTHTIYSTVCCQCGDHHNGIKLADGDAMDTTDTTLNATSNGAGLYAMVVAAQLQAPCLLKVGCTL
jgi:hypothetical protein